MSRIKNSPYYQEYDSSMARDVVELMKNGMSKAEVAREINISKGMWRKFMETVPEFAAAVEEGTWQSLGWWERQGRANLNEGKGFNHILWMMNVKNRFPDEWREKQEKQVVEISLVDLVTKSLEEKKAENMKEVVKEEVGKLSIEIPRFVSPFDENDGK